MAELWIGEGMDVIVEPDETLRLVDLGRAHRGEADIERMEEREDADDGHDQHRGREQNPRYIFLAGAHGRSLAVRFSQTCRHRDFRDSHSWPHGSMEIGAPRL